MLQELCEECSATLAALLTVLKAATNGLIGLVRDGGMDRLRLACDDVLEHSTLAVQDSFQTADSHCNVM
jgi:hypothetical protein